MTRRPDGGKGMSPSADGVIQRGEYRTGAAEHRGPAVATEDGIQKERSPAPGAHAFEPRQILLGMHRQQRLTRGRPGRWLWGLTLA